eukprot:GILJ01006609.1.p1 GENE.GILJ01006609.1~~GILJ01006609.1.p1  ORF type:complete len:387 (+),score=34.76 GILJ01006609.1:75-1163(+)
MDEDPFSSFPWALAGIIYSIFSVTEFFLAPFCFIDVSKWSGHQRLNAVLLLLCSLLVNITGLIGFFGYLWTEDDISQMSFLKAFWVGSGFLLVKGAALVLVFLRVRRRSRMNRTVGFAVSPGSEQLQAKLLRKSSTKDARRYEPEQFKLSAATESVMMEGPSSWSLQLPQANDVTLRAGDGVIQLFTQNDNTVCIQSNLPLPPTQAVCYFEVVILKCPVDANIAIGVASKPYASNVHVGFAPFSIGFHSSTGNRYWNEESEEGMYDSTFGRGDVIGVFSDKMSSSLRFSRNGKLLAVAGKQERGCAYYPSISMAGRGVLVAVNFGAAPFAYKSYNQYALGRAIVPALARSPAPPVTAPKTIP